MQMTKEISEEYVGKFQSLFEKRKKKNVAALTQNGHYIPVYLNRFFLIQGIHRSSTVTGNVLGQKPQITQIRNAI